MACNYATSSSIRKQKKKRPPQKQGNKQEPPHLFVLFMNKVDAHGGRRVTQIHWRE